VLCGILSCTKVFVKIRRTEHMEASSATVGREAAHPAAFDAARMLPQIKYGST
jgi:hypothetical protein